MVSSSSLGKFSTAVPITFLVIIFCIHSIVAASLWLLFRFEDTEIRQQVLGMLCYSLTFFGSISFFYQRYPSMWVLPIHIITLILLPNILAFIPVFSFWILLGFSFIGLFALILTLIRSNNEFPTSNYCSAVVIGSCLGIWSFLFLQGIKGALTLFSDLGIYANFIHNDSVFHSSIIGMLQNFNLPSTGLDGVPTLFYHIGIHRWIASNLHYFLGTPMTLLSSARDILWIPIFLFSLSFSILIASKSTHWLRALAFAVIGNLIYCTINWPSHLSSESHLLSLPIFVSFMPIGLVWLENYYSRDVNISRSLVFMQISCTILAIILCWVAKMSTGLIMTCYLIGSLLVPRFLERPRYWLKLSIMPMPVVVAVSMLFLIKLFLLPSYNFKLFAFYRTFPVITISQILIFTMCLLISWGLLQGEAKLRDSISLLMGSIFLIGQAPGVLFDIGGGSAWYFSDPTIWLAYFLTSSVILMRFKSIVITLHSHLRPTSQISEISLDKNLDNLAEFSINSKLIYITFWIAIGIIIFNSYKTIPTQFYQNVVQPTNAQLKQALSLENSPLSLDVPQDEKGSAWDKFSRFKQRLVPGKIALMKHTELGRIQSIANNLVTDKKSTVIYIPPDTPFWEDAVATTPAVVCWAKPFAIPALTGMPMLNGVRSGVGDCPVTQYYGMNTYTNDSLNRKLDSQELCQRTKKLGFKNVLEIKSDDYKVHVCNGE